MLYELIPTMPEVRLLPLIKRFTTMLAELPVFADPSAPYENEGNSRDKGHICRRFLWRSSSTIDA